MKRFLQELKRRNVLKAALSYVAISWALLQVGALILPLLGMSTSILRIFLIILACGFPVWVVFAYFYELTPGGFKPTSEVEAEKSIHKNTSKRLNGYIMAGLSLAVIFLIADRFLDFEVSLEETETRKSIAVLPFENRGEAEDEYFASGITEDILTQISGIGDLRVLSRFTLKDYNSKGKSPKEIGRELGVSNLLVGSIRKRGDQLRISCQLIETIDESEAWATTFDRRWEDVFKIQSEIALEIANNLKSTLSPREEQLIKSTSTQNIAAYNVYLRGRGIYDTYTAENNERAIDLFKEALRLDPNYGLALAGLADAYCQSYWRFGTRSIDALQTAKEYAQMATEVNPDRPESWKALGLVYIYLGNTEKAKKYYEKALAINPNHTESLNNYGVLVSWEGDLVESIKLYRRSAALQPLSSSPFTNLAMNYMDLDLFDVSKEYADMALDLSQDEVNKLLFDHIYTYVLDDNPEKAETLLHKAADLDNQNASTLAEVGSRLVGWHDPEKGRSYLQRVVTMEDYDNKSNPMVPLSIAYLLKNEGLHLDSANKLIQQQLTYFEEKLEDNNDQFLFLLMASYALQERNELALETMKKLVDNGWTSYLVLEGHRLLEGIRDEDDFKNIIDDLKSKLAVMRKQVLQDDASSQLEGLRN